MASEDWIWEGQKSFPSGHASISFAGMTWITLYLRAAFGVANNVHVTVPALIAASPLVISTWVSISRVRDRWHNTDDIAVGALIGIVSALVVWWHYRLHRAGGRPHSSEPSARDSHSPQPTSHSLLVDNIGDDKLMLSMP
jgi:diacylglycerol diphosphate phosphatase/phosphatidate phosphatase